MLCTIVAIIIVTVYGGCVYTVVITSRIFLHCDFKFASTRIVVIEFFIVYDSYLL